MKNLSKEIQERLIGEYAEKFWIQGDNNFELDSLEVQDVSNIEVLVEEGYFEGTGRSVELTAKGLDYVGVPDEHQELQKKVIRFIYENPSEKGYFSLHKISDALKLDRKKLWASIYYWDLKGFLSDYSSMSSWEVYFTPHTDLYRASDYTIEVIGREEFKSDQNKSQAPAPEKDVARNMKSIDIFISHSNADVEYVDGLIDLLIGALKIPADKIRCTSVDGYRLPAGVTTVEQLRQEIYDTKTFIGVLTSSSLKSPYVLFELGARWGAKRHFAPLLARGTTSKDLGGPLKSLNCLNCDSSGQVHQLINEIADKLNIKTENPASYQAKIEKLLRLSSKKTKTNKSDVPQEPFFENGYYWNINEDGSKDGPFCQICWEKDKKLIHLNSESVDTGDGTEQTMHCRLCSRYY